MSCPVCASEAGRALREALQSGPVAIPLLATVGPFVVLAVIVAWVRFIVAAERMPVLRPAAREKGGQHHVS
jgi:hypothetical protein